MFKIPRWGRPAPADDTAPDPVVPSSLALGLDTTAQPAPLGVVTHDSGLGVGDVFIAWLRGWWIISLCVIFGFYGGYLYLSTVTPRYVVSMVIAPVADNGGANLPGGLGQLVDFLPSSDFLSDLEGSDEFDQLLHLVTSESIAAELATDDALMRQVFESRWDDATDRWTDPPGVWAGLTSYLSGLVGRQVYPPPTVVDLSTFLRAHITVDEITDTSLKRLTMRHHDRALAQRLLTEVVGIADTFLYQRSVQGIDASLANVQQRLEKIALAEHRAALFGLVMSLEYRRSIAKEPYVAAVYEPPNGLTVPTEPGPLRTFIIAVILGLLAGLLGALATYAHR